MAAMAAMFSMAFTACSNNDDELGGQIAQTRGIGFTAAGENSHVTRGFALNASNVATTLPNFQTWAYDAVAGGIYMGTDANTGRTVTNTNMDGTAWDYSPVQFWPVNALNFVAIAPAAPNGVTGNTIAQDGTSKDITLTTAVTLSTNVEDQDDIMFAEGDGVEKGDHEGNVPYTFKHALSQIVFKGKLPANGSITKVTINEITLGNIGKTGNLVFDNNGTFFDGVNAYISTSANDNFTLEASDLEGSVFDAGDDIDAETEGVQARGANAFDLTVSNNATKKNAWMMLPQRSAAWVPANAAEQKAGGLAVAPSTGAYLKIAATLEKDGVTVLSYTSPIYIPLAANWDRSKKYIYTIEFNGLAALTPITFSVAAQDWTDADPQPDQISM